ncbi:MAG: hypothetical protein EGMGGAKC_00296 [Dehalococcoides mccartyi]|nr:hypothetical protein [Dehalococcoides mccartyi]
MEEVCKWYVKIDLKISAVVAVTVYQNDPRQCQKTAQQADWGRYFPQPQKGYTYGKNRVQV